MSLLQRLLRIESDATISTPVTGLSQDDSRHEFDRLADAKAAQSGIVGTASALASAGDYAQALTLIDQALSVVPVNSELHFARGEVLTAWGRIREAHDEYLHAESKGLRTAALSMRLGLDFFRASEVESAEAKMRDALILDPGSIEPLINLSLISQAKNRLDDAIGYLQRALELRPDDFESIVTLGVCKLNQGDATFAEASFRRAIAIDGNRAVAWTNLGTSLNHQDRFREAVEAFQHGDALERDYQEDVDNFVNLALNLADMGRRAEALSIYERELPQRPSVRGYYCYALTLLAAGRLLEGWAHLESRWLMDPFLPVRAACSQPPLLGQDLRGKTVLLRAEQGFGDTIQFVRFAPKLQALGATVVLRGQPELESLAQWFPGIDRILKRNEPTPDFDFYVHPLSLAHTFRVDLDSLPATNIPYIHANEAKAQYWSQRLGAADALRVGIVWAGRPEHPRDRQRSIPLQAFASVCNVEGVRVFSLQKGLAADEIRALPHDLNIVDLGSELEDFSDTAALIAQLDLVICVDTAVAHLAGAQGKPVWLLLPAPADWRWLEGRDDSPWYPTMRLFRQRQRNEWSDVTGRVKNALVEFRNSSAMPLATAVVYKSSTDRRANRGAFGNRPVRAGLTAAVEARDGILQFLPDEPDIGQSLEHYGEYLQIQLDRLARLIRLGQVVIEVGAGVGAHSLMLSRAVGSGGQLFLYESRPVLQRILRQNIAANRITNATIMKRSLSAATQGEAAIDGQAGSAASKVVAFTTETIDELQLARLDWLKINAAVSGLAVLDGATATLWRLRPVLLVGVADGGELSKLKARVEEASYRCWRMETSLFNSANFNQRDDDVFEGKLASTLIAIPEEIDVDVAFEGCVELS